MVIFFRLHSKPLIISNQYSGAVALIVHTNEPPHESNNVVCATSEGSDQPAHMHSLIRAFASSLNIL